MYGTVIGHGREDRNQTGFVECCDRSPHRRAGSCPARTLANRRPTWPAARASVSPLSDDSCPAGTQTRPSRPWRRWPSTSVSGSPSNVSPLQLTPPTLTELRAKADDIERIVAANGGCNVRVFGSVARAEARPGSDVDLLVELEPGTGLLELGAMEDGLAQALDRPVDVVTSAHGRMRHIS